MNTSVVEPPSLERMALRYLPADYIFKSYSTTCLLNALDFALASADLHSMRVEVSLLVRSRLSWCLIRDWCRLQSVGCKSAFHGWKWKCGGCGGLRDKVDVSQTAVCSVVSRWPLLAKYTYIITAVWSVWSAHKVSLAKCLSARNVQHGQYMTAGHWQMEC